MLFKRLIVIFAIIIFTTIAGSIKNEDSGSCGIGTTFPFSVLTKIFDKDEKNSIGDAHKHEISGKVPILGGVAFAQKKAGNTKVTFIELGSVNCIPCRMMQPVMKQVEQKYGDQVKVVFYDVWTEKHREYAYKYNIRAIPTQVFLDSTGKEYYRHVGYFPFEEVEKILKNGGVR